MSAAGERSSIDRSAILMDAQRARDLFQRQLPGFAGTPLVIEDCRILHARFRTAAEDRQQKKAFLSVGYQLDVRDAAGAARGAQVLHVKAYPQGRSLRRFELAKLRSRFVPRFGDAVAHLPELEVVVWAFPNDPKLLHLPEVIDPVAVTRHLPYALLPDGFESPARLRGVEVQVVRYKPEVRCTTRYDLRGGTSSEDVCFSVYGKTFAHARAGAIARCMESLWKRSAEDDDGFIVPRPLGHSESVKTVWQEGLAGTPLLEAIDGGNYAQFLGRAATGLARFHGNILEDLPRTGLADLLLALRAQTAEIVEAFPRFGRPIEAILASLERDASSLRACPPRLVHGDFLLKQMVVHEGRLGIFDLDNLALGDATQDLANYLVNLRFLKLDAGLASLMATAFVRSYRAEADWEVSAERLRWHCRAHLLKAAHYFHKRRHLVAGFEQELERILDLAQLPWTFV